MREPLPEERPVALTIAGSDSGGGAGIQADLKTMEAHGAFGTSAVTAVTAQNTTGVSSSHVLPTEEIEAQLEAVIADFDVRAVKTGMLATREVVELVTAFVRDREVPVVVDPVMVATSGDRLLSPEAEEAYEALVAEATLVTPNADEAAVLTDVEPTDEAGARLAGQRLLVMGADAALVKGGHVEGETVRDTLVTAEYIETAEHPRVDTDATHGSGCTLSAAIAARLATGEPLREAVGHSVSFMQRAVRYPHDVGQGPGAVHHLAALRNEAAREDLRASVRALATALERPVAGATPYAMGNEDVAVADGETVHFGVGGELSEGLVDVRETAPTQRFACFDGEDESAELVTAETAEALYERLG
ncbi:bifunctional hydroxymethylpyrimidine kinase/phosphomethylpyrimidine kinase [Natronomonas sp. EA1]|uniref:bifunctional hydroxymethylpyrimidine kinase/phosphomethylpyrimidine kinase n=1 Tax=Natronomonas sp. EA1 TaxID=3421655 RepID=UPI003EC051EE